jgi:dCMP deaminase
MSGEERNPTFLHGQYSRVETMRISRHQMFADIAAIVAKRSTCMRLSVGAVVVIDRRIVSIGYNGQRPGADHCKKLCASGGCNTIHAEINALNHVPASLWTRPKDLYVTDSPCMNCAKHCKIANVERVFFSTPYREGDPLTWLSQKGVDVFRILPSGIMVDWRRHEYVKELA